MSLFEVYAIKYAGPVTSSGAFVSWLSDWDQVVERNYYYWLLRDGQRAILVDCGSRPDQAVGGTLPGYQSPEETLARVGLAPVDISDVILTHLHWDHAGAAPLFPRAVFHAHARELDFWLSDPVVDKAPFRLLADRTCLDFLAGLAGGPRLNRVASDGPFLPGITGLFAPGHSPGLLAVKVQTASGPVVLGSDCGHFFANYRKKWPTSLIFDLPAWIRSFDKLSEAAGEGLLLPGHDPLMTSAYPQVAEGITRLA